MLRVRLTRKLAPVLNGVDISKSAIGDVLDLPDATARMLVAEGWAELVTDHIGPPIRPEIRN